MANSSWRAADLVVETAWLRQQNADGVVAGYDVDGWEDSTWILHAMYELPDLSTDYTHDDSHRAELAAGAAFLALGLTTTSGQLLRNESAIMGSRYATKQEVLESLDLVARGEVWPIVTDTRPMTETDAEALHDSLELGEISGRAALII